jgi:hypothetical protein
MFGDIIVNRNTIVQGSFQVIDNRWSGWQAEKIFAKLAVTGQRLCNLARIHNRRLRNVSVDRKQMHASANCKKCAGEGSTNLAVNKPQYTLAP